jgi:hypothetical protein
MTTAPAFCSTPIAPVGCLVEADAALRQSGLSLAGLGGVGPPASYGLTGSRPFEVPIIDGAPAGTKQREPWNDRVGAIWLLTRGRMSAGAHRAARPAADPAADASRIQATRSRR